VMSIQATAVRLNDGGVAYDEEPLVEGVIE